MCLWWGLTLIYFQLAWHLVNLSNFLIFAFGKATPKSSWLYFLEDTDIALGRALEDWGCGLSCWGLLSGSLLRDLDLASSLGGDIEGRLREKGVHAEGIVGGFEEEFVGVFFFFFGGDFSNGGGDRGASHGDFVGGCCCMTSAAGCRDSVVMLGFIRCFFFLLRSVRFFRFVEVSTSSGCSGFFVFGFFFYLLEGDDSGWVAASVGVVTTAFVIVPLVYSILLFTFLITWVHPSSGFGWSPSFRTGLMVGLMVFSWLLLLVWLLFINFCRQDLARWPSCFQYKQNGLLPSMTTIICWSWYVNMWGMAWKPSLLRQISRM